MFHILPLFRSLFGWDEEEEAWLTDDEATPSAVNQPGVVNPRFNSGESLSQPLPFSRDDGGGSPVLDQWSVPQWRNSGACQRSGPGPSSSVRYCSGQLGGPINDSDSGPPPSGASCNTQYCACLCNSVSQLVGKTETGIQTDDLTPGDNGDSNKVIIKAPRTGAKRPVISRPFMVETQTVMYNGQFRTVTKHPRNHHTYGSIGSKRSKDNLDYHWNECMYE